MRITTIRYEGCETAAVVTPRGIIPISVINRSFNTRWKENVFDMIQTNQLPDLNEWYLSKGREQLEELSHLILDNESIQFSPLFRHPGKIWGIGLNYAEHAADLDERSPASIPASFMKPDTTIIGNGDTINIPVQSQRTTGEAELGIVMGRTCKDIEPEEWISYVAGFTTILDMTAEDILRRNPRYLTLSKSFDTFFSFGPQLITPDEIQNIQDIHVSTVLNRKIVARNSVSNMTFPPDHLVSFHSGIMTLLPGDIICSGTPGAAVLGHGDRLECHIDGFPSLMNPVRDLKNNDV